MKRTTMYLLAGAALALFLSGCEIPPSQQEAEKPIPQAESALEQGRLVSVSDPGSYILLGQYQDRTWESLPASMEQVEEEIERRLLEDSSSLKGDETVQEGDTVVINYVGTLGYETFDGSIANNYQLTVGQEGMFPGFEEALLGMKVGDTVTCEQGDATYRITLQSFTRPALLTEEWAREQGYEGVENMKEAIGRELEQAVLLNPALRREEVFQIFLSEAQLLDYPKADLERARLSYQRILERYARDSSMDYESFLASQGLTGEALEAALLSYSEKKVFQDLALQTVLDEQDLSLEDALSVQITQSLADTYAKGDVKALEQSFDAQELLEAVAYERVLIFLMEGR